MTDQLQPSAMAREYAAKHLGYRDWDDASDYRLSGAQDRERDALVQLLARFEQALKHAMPEREANYAEFQQRRGRLPDLIEGAIEIYDGWMKDDDYDTRRCLDRVIDKLKSAREWYDLSLTGDVREAVPEREGQWVDRATSEIQAYADLNQRDAKELAGILSRISLASPPAAPDTDQELEEIADGAYGNGPMVRGLARDALAEKAAPDMREAGEEPWWRDQLRQYAYPSEADTKPVAALKKAARVITQMHQQKAWCSSDVQDTLDMIAAALASSPMDAVKAAVEAQEDEAYEIGKKDGYALAVQDIDVLTGGDGEYFASTIPGRGCPDEDSMKARIVKRFDDMLAAAEHEGKAIDRLIAALSKIAPITTRDTPDYAELNFGEHHTRAMTMMPDDWLEIEAAYQGLTAIHSRGEG